MPPTQSLSLPSQTSAAPGLELASASSQSVERDDSCCAVSHTPSAASTGVPSEVPNPSWSASTKQVMVSNPSQSWSTLSSGISVAPGNTVIARSSQSSPATMVGSSPWVSFQPEHST